MFIKTQRNYKLALKHFRNCSDQIGVKALFTETAVITMESKETGGKMIISYMIFNLHFQKMSGDGMMLFDIILLMIKA